MKSFLLLLTILAVGCSPVKKVQKDPSKVQKVVEFYLKNHPFKSDTVTNVITGQTETIVDTFSYVDVYRDSFYLDRYHTITKTITKHRVDTLIRVIRDNSFVQSLQKSSEVKDGQIQELKEQVKIIGKKADKRNYRFFGLLFLICIYGFLRFKRIL